MDSRHGSQEIIKDALSQMKNQTKKSMLLSHMRRLQLDKNRKQTDYEVNEFFPVIHDPDEALKRKSLHNSDSNNKKSKESHNNNSSDNKENNDAIDIIKNNVYHYINDNEKKRLSEKLIDIEQHQRKSLSRKSIAKRKLDYQDEYHDDNENENDPDENTNEKSKSASISQKKLSTHILNSTPRNDLVPVLTSIENITVSNNNKNDDDNEDNEESTSILRVKNTNSINRTSVKESNKSHSTISTINDESHKLDTDTSVTSKNFSKKSNNNRKENKKINQDEYANEYDVDEDEIELSSNKRSSINESAVANKTANKSTRKSIMPSMSKLSIIHESSKTNQTSKMIDSESQSESEDEECKIKRNENSNNKKLVANSKLTQSVSKTKKPFSNNSSTTSGHQATLREFMSSKTSHQSDSDSDDENDSERAQTNSKRSTMHHHSHHNTANKKSASKTNLKKELHVKEKAKEHNSIYSAIMEADDNLNITSNEENTNNNTNNENNNNNNSGMQIKLLRDSLGHKSLLTPSIKESKIVIEQKQEKSKSHRILSSSTTKKKLLNKTNTKKGKPKHLVYSPQVLKQISSNRGENSPNKNTDEQTKPIANKVDEDEFVKPSTNGLLLNKKRKRSPSRLSHLSSVLSGNHNNASLLRSAKLNSIESETDDATATGDDENELIMSQREKFIRKSSKSRNNTLHSSNMTTSSHFNYGNDEATVTDTDNERNNGYESSMKISPSILKKNKEKIKEKKSGLTKDNKKVGSKTAKPAVVCSPEVIREEDEFEETYSNSAIRKEKNSESKNMNNKNIEMNNNDVDENMMMSIDNISEFQESLMKDVPKSTRKLIVPVRERSPSPLPAKARNRLLKKNNKVTETNDNDDDDDGHKEAPKSFISIGKKKKAKVKEKEKENKNEKEKKTSKKSSTKQSDNIEAIVSVANDDIDDGSQPPILVKVTKESKEKKKKVNKAPKEKVYIDIMTHDDAESHENAGGDDGLRRSKRVRLETRRNLKPVYEKEIITDFWGRKIAVTKIVRFEKDESDLAQFRKKMLEIFAHPKNHAPKAKNELKSKKSKVIKQKREDRERRDSSQEIDARHANKNRNTIEDSLNVDSIDSHHAPHVDDIVMPDNDNNDDSNSRDRDDSQENKQQLVKVTRNSNYRRTFFNHMENEEFNHNNEIILVEDVNSLELIPSNIVRFQKMCDKRDYNELSKGVAISVIGESEVMIRIDENATSELSEHDSDITLFVQRGYCIVFINNNKILMQMADKIKIPKFNKYSISNPSSSSKAFICLEYTSLQNNMV